MKTVWIAQIDKLIFTYDKKPTQNQVIENIAITIENLSRKEILALLNNLTCEPIEIYERSIIEIKEP